MMSSDSLFVYLAKAVLQQEFECFALWRALSSFLTHTYSHVCCTLSAGGDRDSGGGRTYQRRVRVQFLQLREPNGPTGARSHSCTGGIRASVQAKSVCADEQVFCACRAAFGKVALKEANVAGDDCPAPNTPGPSAPSNDSSSWSSG